MNEIKAVQIFMPDSTSREYAKGDGYTKLIEFNRQTMILKVVSINGLISEYANIPFIVMSASSKEVEITKGGGEIE